MKSRSKSQTPAAIGSTKPRPFRPAKSHVKRRSYDSLIPSILNRKDTQTGGRTDNFPLFFHCLLRERVPLLPISLFSPCRLSSEKFTLPLVRNHETSTRETDNQTHSRPRVTCFLARSNSSLSRFPSYLTKSRYLASH